MLHDFDTDSPINIAAAADLPGDPAATQSGAALHAATGEEETASIQALREMRGLGIVELSGLAGILPDHLRAIEAGVEPTMPEKQAIAAALNVPVERIA